MAGKKLSLREKIDQGLTTFGFATYLGAVPAIEIGGNWGLDFAFIDTEHTAGGIDYHMEKLIMASLLAGIAPLVRVRGTIEWEIRKVLELGAAGVVVPQVNRADQARAIVSAVRFPPWGLRGGDASVRSASYGGPGFQWSSYIEKSNREPLVTIIAENFEFFDNIDEILAVDGIDIVNFGPADYALSRQISIDPTLTDPEIVGRLEVLIEKCHARGIKVMVPCLPPTGEAADRLKKMGVDMIILGTDIMFLNQGCRAAGDIKNLMNSGGS